MNIDTEKEGLKAFFQDWQVPLVVYLHETGREMSSRDCWQYLRDIDVNISRASVINFLKQAYGEGILHMHEVTGKGGHRAIYKARVRNV